MPDAPNDRRKYLGHKMKQTLLALGLIWGAAASTADPAAAPVRAEIDALLDKLQRSGC